MQKMRSWEQLLELNASFEDMVDGTHEWMQFTGLTDKNGKEIYEGDITEFEEGPDDVGAYDTVRRVVEFMPEGYWANATGEVIGNVWENPDLLEK